MRNIYSLSALDKYYDYMCDYIQVSENHIIL